MILGIPIPIAMIAAGVVFLLAAVKVLFSQRRTVEVVPYSNVRFELPTKWDDAEITKLLQRHHDQPAVLSHAISEIRGRMILNQDIKTAQKRLKLIASVIEVFKLNRELQGVLQDIRLAEMNFEIKQVEAQIGLEDAQARLKSERLLRDLRKQRDELQLQREIAQLKADTDSIVNPPKPPTPPRQPPIEEQIAAQEAKIKRYEQESAERQKNAASPPEAQKWKVFYEDLLHDAQEDLKKLLRRR